MDVSAIRAGIQGVVQITLQRMTHRRGRMRSWFWTPVSAERQVLPRSPNLNAFAERFVRSIKEECLDRMIFVGQGSLRLAVAEYVAHYHGERNQQGMSNRLLMPREWVGTQHGSIRKRERLGGMLNYYDRRAA